MIRGTGETGKGAQRVFGFSVKMGLVGDAHPAVKPFSNIYLDAKSGEPVVDVFEKSDHTLVVIEVPGIGAGDFLLDIRDDLLDIRAESGTKRYRKEILLPRSHRPEQLKSTCNNGLLEIRCHSRE